MWHARIRCGATGSGRSSHWRYFAAYAVVHAYGELRIIDDPDWLRHRLGALTQQHEASFAEPWAVTDAPREYTGTLIKAIVGIEMVISKLRGKWKVSQNQPERNQAGVVRGLRQGDAAAAEMADLVEERSREAR